LFNAGITVFGKLRPRCFCPRTHNPVN